VRVDFETGDKMFPDNSVVISKDGGKNLTVIDPTRRSLYEIGVDQIFNPTRLAMTFANPPACTAAATVGPRP
jgi:hypothetical protein